MYILAKGKPKTVHILKDKPNKWAGTKTWGCLTKREVDGTLTPKGRKTIQKFGARTNVWHYGTVLPMESELFGGRLHSLGGNVYHVCRGSVLELEGKTYLCFGGAESQDKDDREPGVNWWKQEMPSDEEYDTCRRNLEKVDYKVDYVLTHDAPSRFLDFTALALGESNRLHLFLDEILLKLTYEKWFFGCYHKDVQLSTKSRCVFCDVIPMGERRTGLFHR